MTHQQQINPPPSPPPQKLNLVFFTTPQNPRKVQLAITKSIDSNKPEVLFNDVTSNNIKFATFLSTPNKPNFKTILIDYHKNVEEKFKNGPLVLQFNYELLSEQFGPVLTDAGLSLTQYLIKQFGLLGLTITDSSSKPKSKSKSKSSKSNANKETEDHHDDDEEKEGNEQQQSSFFVDAYNGTKEGSLYFLPLHVVFGFKKPILIFKSSDIDSITYTSITRLTFNVTLHVKIPTPTTSSTSTSPQNPSQTQPSGSGLQKFEFSMIDQQEFEKIDQYVKFKSFRDKSMTEELKAQKQLKDVAHNDSTNALIEAAKQIPGGEKLIDGQEGQEGQEGDDEDEEDDGDYNVGDSDDDHSDQSDNDDDDSEGDDDESNDDDDDDADVNDDSEYESPSHAAAQQQQSTNTPSQYLNLDDFDDDDDDDEEDEDHNDENDDGDDDDDEDDDQEGYEQLEFDPLELQQELKALNEELDEVNDAGYLQFVQQNYNN
ncbi:unnamed protein product [Ambrosiozyma monospora]|uniref:Histone chaperone RTT106 n=1 Tax=Ambrosiozyma monospora TaxID=43982 RepID=A0A9W7DGU9_AMBMO|nr:unnamed protein product [Ambrosiozyma monospora]